MAVGGGPAPAVFIDKDGTLVEDVPYNADPGLITLTRDAGRALARLAGAGYRLVVVTNQSGVARGFFDEDDLRGVRARLEELLSPYGVSLDGFYYCPHHPEGTVPALAIECDCRKPRPGLLLRAARDLDLELASSWMVGDILDDVEAGCRAGCRTALVAGGETLWRDGDCREPTLLAGDLADAAEAILAGPAALSDGRSMAAGEGVR